MSDISVFKKILEQPNATSASHAAPKILWLCAYERQPGLYSYHVGNRGWAIRKLGCFDLEGARAAANQLAGIYQRVVKESGPPEAFGRKVGT
jgi:hypothetical protein